MKPSNVLTIKSLDEEWRDKDSVILHACFQILTNFVEKELVEYDFVDWEQDEKYKFAKKEIDFLYNWWFSYKENEVLNTESHQIENEMLKRLIDIRWVLWT